MHGGGWKAQIPHHSSEGDRVVGAGSDANSHIQKQPVPDGICSRSLPRDSTRPWSSPSPPSVQAIGSHSVLPQAPGTHCAQKHKSLHVGVRCSTSLKPQRQASQSCHWPLGFLLAAKPAQVCSVLPRRSNQRKMLEIEEIRCHLKKYIKKKTYVMLFYVK